ncbi:MAG: MBL fold metallo-hydrolase [Nocardioidaceae bacterium]
MTSRLVVLGSCGAWPEPGRACSGFVLEHSGLRIVLDLGYGTLSRLLAHLGSSVARGVDAVVVTHKHPDHMLDLHGLFRSRWFGDPGAAPIPLYAPRGVVQRLQGLEEDDAEAILRVFDWHPLPAGPYDVGPFRLTSWDLPHYVPNAGVRLESDDLVVAYTGDTGHSPQLAELGRAADLFIVEATDRDQQGGTSSPGDMPNMLLTSRAAGEAASAAGAQRLLLTHFWPGNNRERSRADAQEAFAGEVLLAEEGLSIDLQRNDVGINVGSAPSVIPRDSSVSMKVPPVNVAQVAQHADDLDRATRFYSVLTGLEPAASFDPPGLVFFGLGGVRLLLDRAASSTLIYLHVPDVRERVEELRAAGVDVATEPHVIFQHEDDTLGPAGTDEWMAFVRDTEGNLVGLVSHHEPGSAGTSDGAATEAPGRPSPT